MNRATGDILPIPLIKITTRMVRIRMKLKAKPKWLSGIPVKIGKKIERLQPEQTARYVMRTISIGDRVADCWLGSSSLS